MNDQKLPGDDSENVDIEGAEPAAMVPPSTLHERDRAADERLARDLDPDRPDPVADQSAEDLEADDLQ